MDTITKWICETIPDLTNKMITHTKTHTYEYQLWE